jgi:hypothetical protein
MPRRGVRDLAVWQRTNVTAFLVSGIAGTVPGVVGEPYRDASGNEYLPIYEADGAALSRAYERAMSRGLTPAIYTRELFETGHDEANRAAVAAVPADDLDLVGLAFRAERKAVDKVVDRLRFHPLAPLSRAARPGARTRRRSRARTRGA